MPLGREVRLLIKDVNRMCIDLANPLQPSRYVVQGSFNQIPVAVVAGPEESSLPSSLAGELDRYFAAAEQLERANSASQVSQVNDPLADSTSDDVNSESGLPTPVLSPSPLPWPLDKTPLDQYHHLSFSTFTVPLARHKAKLAAPIRPQSANGSLVSKEWHGPGSSSSANWEHLPELQMAGGSITPPAAAESPMESTIPPPSQFGSCANISEVSFKSASEHSAVFDGYSTDSFDERLEKTVCTLYTPRHFWKFYGLQDLADMKTMADVRSYNHPKIDPAEEIDVVNRYFIKSNWRVAIEKKIIGWRSKDPGVAKDLAQKFGNTYAPQPLSFNFDDRACLERHIDIYFLFQVCRKLYRMYKSMYEHVDTHFDVQKKRDYFNLKTFYRELATGLGIHIQFDQLHRQYNLATIYNHIATHIAKD